jgi:uncharacterized protein
MSAETHDRERSRRAFLEALAATATVSLAAAVAPLRASPARSAANPLRVRTITAGVPLRNPRALAPIDAALGVLERARQRFVEEGYEVQTLRITTPPFLAQADARTRDAALAPLQALDDVTTAREVRVSIGPVLSEDRLDLQLVAWTAELIRTTKNLNATVSVTSPERGVSPAAATVAARIMADLAGTTSGGIGNFRFAAIANVRPGTPFFPAGYHDGPDALAVGMEAAGLVEAAAREGDAARVTERLRDRMNAAFAPVERIASAVARREGRVYLGIDPSPAPGKDRSIGAGIEALTGVPFGSASTLGACAAITGALKSLDVRTCGYAGLMLPVLEDPVLAQRASEGRFGVHDLLLYSSVCGTGLDVVPLPADTPVDVAARLITDVATLASRLDKPLSARLFLIPGRRAGEVARFDDPYLTDCAVMPLR